MDTFDHLTDSDLLAWLLWGEAGGEGALGQLAVAWSVLNRVAKPRWWGDDVRSVIMRAGQYDGLKRIPAYVRSSTFTGPPPLGCEAVAQLALAGATVDPTNGATHFHAVWVARPWALPEVWRYGGHVFYRED